MALTERFEGFTVASALAARATADPTNAYLRFGDRVYTFAEVESDAQALAAGLAHLGVETGDRVALVLPPCPEFVIGLFAAANLGATIVPLNPRLTTPELQYMLRHSEAVCAITIEELNGVDFLQLFEDLMPQLPDLQYLVTVGEEDLWYDDRIFQFEDLVSSGSGRDYAAPATVQSSDGFAILYTSGTMGKPKGVELSHANMLGVAAATADRFGLKDDDRIIGVTALFHVFGLGPGVLSTVLAGACLILQDEAGAAATLDLAERHRATVHYGVPTMFVAELAQLEGRRRDLGAMRLAVVAGAPVSDDLVDRIGREMGGTVLTAYSLTETSSTVVGTSPGDSPEKRRFTVGKPLPGTEIRVVETDGSVLPVESVGEIGVRGPGVMLGYYRQPKETAQAFDEDGYFRTGDLGILDEDGYLHLVGRRKDVIIRSGFNVYPREVETRIESHPAVQEVAVIGLADPLLGEAICACIVPVEGAIVTGHEIVGWCRETLAEDKVPDSVRFLDGLPRTDTGKVRRVDLSRLIQTESDPA
jgi:acyl-CoA synthetase (AMP-forming)/AMP-acid ligase II